MDLFIAYLLGLLTATKMSIKPAKSQHTQQETSKQSSPASTVARFDTEVSPSVVNDHKANESQKKWWPQTFKEWAEVFGVLVLMIYTATTIALWYAANEANNQGKRNSYLEQRAWVAVSEIAPSDETKSPWEISIVFKNTGRTPAKNFAVQLIGEEVAKGVSPSGKEDVSPGHAIITPDGVFHSRLSSRNPIDWRTTDLIIHGKVSYDSIFGHRHWTQFCYYFVPKKGQTKGGFSPCDEGNQMDENEP